MDIASAGAAAVQVSAAQRAQQAAIAGIRQARIQGQTLANLLSQITTPAQTASTNASSVVSAPTSVGNDNLVSGDQPQRNLPRGSLVNILV